MRIAPIGSGAAAPSTSSKPTLQPLPPSNLDTPSRTFPCASRPASPSFTPPCAASAGRPRSPSPPWSASPWGSAPPRRSRARWTGPWSSGSRSASPAGWSRSIAPRRTSTPGPSRRGATSISRATPGASPSSRPSGPPSSSSPCPSDAVQVRVKRVTGNLFPLLGVPALHGRLLAAGDDRPDQPAGRGAERGRLAPAVRRRPRPGRPRHPAGRERLHRRRHPAAPLRRAARRAGGPGRHLGADALHPRGAGDADHELPPRARPPGARRQPGDGRRRAGPALRRAGRGDARPPGRGRARAAAPGGGRARGAGAAAPRLRRRRDRAAHRRHQRDQPAAGARGAARPRDRHPGGAGRHPGPGDAAGRARDCTPHRGGPRAGRRARLAGRPLDRRHGGPAAAAARRPGREPPDRRLRRGARGPGRARRRDGARLARGRGRPARRALGRARERHGPPRSTGC